MVLSSIAAETLRYMSNIVGLLPEVGTTCPSEAPVSRPPLVFCVRVAHLVSFLCFVVFLLCFRPVSILPSPFLIVPSVFFHVYADRNNTYCEIVN